MRLFREMPPVMDVSSQGLIRPQARTLVGFRPIPGALVTLRDMNGTLLEQVRTDESGNTPLLEVPTPPLEYSLEPDSPQPYAQYTLTLEGEGVQTVTVEGTQVLPGEITLQQLTAIDTATADLVSPVPVADETLINIGPSTLYGNYPPKEPEASVKPLNPDDGFVVLNEVVIPEYIVVHDGTPSSNAQNYWIPYASYIANVASSEIYSTWEEAAITANVLAILSFTLNRVYTEWYRSKGYDFTITSSTAYDHKFIYGRSIYENIARVVDSVLTNYVTRPGIEQPLLTQYCDGRQVSCPNWMTQWGSQHLATQGYNAVSILRYYYGADIYLETANRVSGVPSSFPGYNIQEGSRGTDVRTIQRQLNAIAKNYPAIPTVAVDGIFGPATKASVQKFQDVFNLPPNGIVDYPTWYRLSQIYVAVTRIAELN
ncbi:MAG TPA: peptidoglycan-binding protein [Candidatus Faecimorpha stercoravium]|nr:peptidoglycan-binding protein [Candidatus Faecimorpha stercoravium]